MTCEACITAAREPSGLFMTWCNGCAARALARSPDFRASMEQGGPTDHYRAAVRALGVKHADVIAAARADFQTKEAAWLKSSS